jgi:tryptophan 2,3-dioxygenase
MDKNEPNVFKSSDLTYGKYLRVPELCQLQFPQSTPAHHDEMLFIIIHQAYELWFKLMLHEMEKVIHFLKEGSVLDSRHFLNRIVEILKLLVKQIHILETMRPVDFLEFRERLQPASGFQSLQFRELEFLAGAKEERYLQFFKNDPTMVKVLTKRLNEPDLRVYFHELLKKQGFKVPPMPKEWKEMEQEAFVNGMASAVAPIYQDPEKHAAMYILCETFLELDEYMILWRQHHVRVVERIIGNKTGTGGSSGVQYLRMVAEKKCFPFLWDARSYLTKRT